MSNMKKWLWAIIFILGVLSSSQLGNDNPLTKLLYLVAFILLIISLYKTYKVDKNQEKLEHAAGNVRVLTMELDKLDKMFAANIINEEEYELKRDSLKKQYSSSVDTYINDKDWRA
ncbi:SHOCT domain-containing protein [Paenibacillus sp. PAMC 26794]|uniref:SHOCT domain-containing protein n=1 Tax=Paenibacillus sp. PAMC 26794 TaxID=1257080 RepID=UPI00036656D8|nr:SHOCT domain-containing protein [Paenibacillus sp. PAMC 26794]